MGIFRVSGIRGWVPTVIASFALAGCNDLFDSGGNGDSTPVSNLQLTGIVVDGPVVAGTVRVRDADGTLLAETTTDGAARYVADVAVEEAAFPLIVTVTGGTNLVTGGAPEVELASFITAPFPNVTANVTMFSTLVVGVAERLPDGITARNISRANTALRDGMSFGLNPGDFDVVAVAPVNDGNVAEVVKASEALAEMLRRTTNELMAVGQASSVQDVLDALEADLVDGVVDGRGAPGVNERAAAMSIVTTAQVMLEAMTNTLRVNNVDASNSMDTALQQVLSMPDPAVSTDDVPVTFTARDQTIAAVNAALAVDDNPDLAELSQRLSQIGSQRDPDQVAAMLPVNAPSELDAAISIVQTAPPAQLALVNGGDGVNRPPVIAGDPSSQVTETATYIFVPTAYDADDDPLTFEIKSKPTWATFNKKTGELKGKPAKGDAGTYSDIEISVSDGTNTRSLGTFDVDVEPLPNLAPTISGTPPAQVTVGNAYGFTPSASDPDGDSLSFSIQGRPSWASFNSGNGRLSGTPDAGDVGSYSNIRITVSDGTDSRTLAAFSIDVSGVPNRAPSISGNPVGQVQVGQPYVFTPAASDADGDSLSYTIQGKPGWASFNSSSGRLSGTPNAGNVGTSGAILISVSDGRDSATLPAFTITVTPLPNQPPSISGTPATQVTAGNAYSFTPSASDPDGDNLTFNILGRPAWASFNSGTGRLSGTPDAGDEGTYSNIRISVSDGEDSRTLSAFSITVAAAPNQAPSISGNPATQVTAGNAYSFAPSASDADGDNLEFFVLGRPTWATFNGSTGRLSGTPSAADVGTYSNILIRVTDGEDSTTLPAFSITVNGLPNRAPSISGNPATQVTAGNAYSFTPSASDPDGDNLTFSILGRPAWASFNSGTGRLSGTPDAGDEGTYSNIRITVSDGEDSDTLAAFQVVVEEAVVQNVFHQSDEGLLVMEAEHFDTNVGGNGVGPWQVVDQADAFNLQALKSPGGTFTASPDTARSEYRAKFVVPGTHYLWIRVRAFDNGSDSVYAELDSNGAVQFSLGDKSGNWVWARLPVNLGVTMGVHTVKLYRRESNLEVDRVLVTSSASYTPTGLGPAESSRAAPGDDAPPPPNLPPVISGTPSAQTTMGQPYSFTPSAYDPEGSAMSFGIQGRPSWATFNSINGRLEGTPGVSDAGTYTNIRISVTDGQNSAQLPAFSIAVLTTATGGFTVNWDPPLTNTDGSTITDLVGYRVYRGTQTGQYSEIVPINSPGTTSYVFDELPFGTTHYIVVTSVDASGNESAPSEEVSITL